ncbi:testis-expressed protein 26-like [Trichomycterus rosablanca]|uniref:testis-expressed protein 26-like n=1 Tax=Trichomycterus rosablanca TaxID=2290929 RepID=UPI002F353679
MANSGNSKWDPYETLQNRDFVYRPGSSIPALRPQTSRGYRNVYALADPVGRTAYSDDFGWKSQSKPVCIRTGSGTGNRRNNPHPSQFFMIWKLPPGVKLCENPPSVEDVRDAVASQYTSTYRTDFLRLHQGKMMNQRALALPKPSPDAPQPMQTEMKQNFHKPIQKAELQENNLHYGSSVGCGGPLKGIVPTVVQKHITNQESWKLFSTYERYFGGKSTDFASLLMFPQPAELQNLCKNLPENDGKLVMRSILQRSPVPPDQEKIVKLPVKSSHSPPVLNRISVWSGPL